MHGSYLCKLFFILLLACASMFMNACSAGAPKPTAKLEDVLAREDKTQQEINQINSKLFSSANNAPTLDDYIIGEGDLLQVTVFEAQELKTEMRVGARGFITLPLVGPVEVKGLTTRSAEQKIEGLYRTKYLHDPHVNVFVSQQVAGKVTVLGAVKKPGTIPYLSRQTLFDILASSEGLSEKAGHTVQVRRATDDPAHPEIFIIDLDQIVKNGQAELNIEIQRGDVIYVPMAGTVYVDGAVRKPGNIAITQAMTIQEAIAAAGGLTVTASQSDVKLVRSDAEGKRDVTQLSLKAIQDESTNAQRVEVKDRDVIFVESSIAKTLLYGLRPSFGLPGVMGIGFDSTGLNR